MSKKNKRVWGRVLGGIGLLAFILAIMNWMFPYSPLSVIKSYRYQPYDVSFDDGSFQINLANFRDSYEDDLEADSENKYPNLTITNTEGILSFFEQQDWLTSDEPVSFSKTDLSDMLFKVQQVKETLLSLFVRVDYTIEQREYLVTCLRKIESIEEEMIDLQHVKFASRGELEDRFDNLFGDYLNSFTTYVTFYESQFLFQNESDV